MKILPNIKYDGMEFTCRDSIILLLKFVNGNWYVTDNGDMRTSAKTNMKHIRESLENGYWKRII